MQFLFGLTGQMKAVKDHLLTYWTAVRAAKIDNLDAAISTRAAASTAVSNADYTAGKAVFLDSAISGRLGSIKAIYTGEIHVSAGLTSNTATITAVVAGRSICLLNGVRGAGANYYDSIFTVRLTSTTVITATRAGTSGDHEVGYTVVEFNP